MYLSIKSLVLIQLLKSQKLSHYKFVKYLQYNFKSSASMK